MKKTALKAGIYALILIAAVFLFPLHMQKGNGLSPLIQDGDLLIGMRWNEPYINDVIFYLDNKKIKVGRITADAGQSVEIKADGRLYIDGIVQQEYHDLDNMSLCSIAQNHYCLYDGEMVSVIAKEQISGKVIFLMRRREF